MKSTRISYIFTVLVIAAYEMFYIGWQARFARKWMLPVASLILVVLIPITWLLFMKRRKKTEVRSPSIWPQLGLIPVWFHSLYITWWILGWMSTGGL